MIEGRLARETRPRGALYAFGLASCYCLVPCAAASVALCRAGRCCVYGVEFCVKSWRRMADGPAVAGGKLVPSKGVSSVCQAASSARRQGGQAATCVEICLVGRLDGAEPQEAQDSFPPKWSPLDLAFMGDALLSLRSVSSSFVLVVAVVSPSVGSRLSPDA